MARKAHKKDAAMHSDVLGTNKVRVTPEHTTRTHWAGLINFARIFTAPVIYLILPVVVLWATGCFGYCADFINGLIGSATFGQYGVMAIVATLLWQLVVCWGVWRSEVKKYEQTPQYEYHFYNDIVEYKRRHVVPTPKLIKALKFLINLIPALVCVGVFAGLIIVLFKYIKVEPSPDTPPSSGTGSDTSVQFDWSAMWAAIEGVFASVVEFITKEENLPVLLIILAVVVILIIVSIIKALKQPNPTVRINPARTIPARTLPAIITASKKLPTPAYIVPDNCPRWLKKIIFWAPVHYNYGDVVITSPKGADDEIVLARVEKPEALIDYLSTTKSEPTEAVSYGKSC